MTNPLALGQSMKQITLVCEAQVTLGQSADEANNPSGKIEARVTTWGAREGADGRRFNYQPEGFAAWADEFAKSDKPMPMFLNHNDLGMPIGQWDEVMFDDEGMSAKGRLYLNTVGGSDAYAVLKESPKMFGGVSVGAYADEACMVNAEGNAIMSGDDDSEAYFQITKGGLREISVVMYPNNPEANIQQLEYFDASGNINPRTIEKVLRDAGVSRKDATTVSCVLKKALEQRDAAKALESAPNQGDPDTVVIEADAILNALNERELLKALSKRL
jgi:HK97 family phage prohead protease